MSLDSFVFIYDKLDFSIERDKFAGLKDIVDNTCFSVLEDINSPGNFILFPTRSQIMGDEQTILIQLVNIIRFISNNNGYISDILQYKFIHKFFSNKGNFVINSKTRSIDIMQYYIDAVGNIAPHIRRYNF